jgi:bifunctional DNA-binding transcriptional regulator/antitoxin component of YhaV-PrlF toxin-antitoxin module
MLAKLTSKNQLTLPKAAVQYFHDATHFVIEVKEDALILKPARVQTEGETLAAVRKKIKRLGLKEDDVKTAVRWARSKNK